jgi:fluoride exporter
MTVPKRSRDRAIPMTKCLLVALGGAIGSMLQRTHWSPNWRYLIPIGFLGGYSTFSSFEYETFRVFQDGNFSSRA